MDSLVRLTSNFKDYYDDAFKCREPEILKALHEKRRVYSYDRCRSNSISRAKELKRLNIPTIPIKAASMLATDLNASKLLIYTDATLHNGKGKLVVSNQDAQNIYPNLPARRFVPISETGGFTLKCLQVGKRRFKVLLWSDTDTLDYKVHSIEEIEPMYNRSYRYPIFSIDYLPTKEGLMVIDFNQVENLGNLGMDKYMTPSEVYDAVVDYYNYFY